MWLPCFVAHQCTYRQKEEGDRERERLRQRERKRKREKRRLTPQEKELERGAQGQKDGTCELVMLSPFVLHC